jgi:hypothetical protein
MEEFEVSDVERIDGHKGTIIVVDIHATGESLDSAVIRCRHRVA